MNTTTKVIIAILGVIGVGALIYFLTKPKEAAKPTTSTGSGNSFNLSLGGWEQSYGGTGLNGVNSNGEQVINGMTQAQYLAAGYPAADVALIFA
jgi:hypothetical protein